MTWLTGIGSEELDLRKPPVNRRTVVFRDPVTHTGRVSNTDGYGLAELMIFLLYPGIKLKFKEKSEKTI